MKTNASGSPRKLNTTSSTGSGACIVMPAMSAPLTPLQSAHGSPTSILSRATGEYSYRYNLRKDLRWRLMFRSTLICWLLDAGVMSKRKS